MKCAPFVALLTLLSLATSAAAQNAELTLPLGEHYRPGKYLPVRVAVANTQNVVLTGDTAIETHWTASGSSEVLVPWLCFRDQSVKLIADSSSPIELRALRPNERLVGYFSGDSSQIVTLGQSLFPDHICIAQRISVSLDAPSWAWHTLDAIVLDAFLTPEQTRRLLAAGMAIVVRTPNPPKDLAGWNQLGSFWVLQFPPHGPQTAGPIPGAYIPTQLWPAGRSLAFRRQAFLFAVLFCIFFIAALLLKRRARFIAACTVALVSSGLLILWRSHQPAIQQAVGRICIVDSAGRVQQDIWSYQRGVETSSLAMPLAPGTLLIPVLESPKQIQHTNLTLQVDASGARFHGTLPKSSTLAFVHRSIESSRPSVETTTPVTSPLRELMPLYLTRETTLVGESPAGDVWPMILLENRPQ